MMDEVASDFTHNEEISGYYNEKSSSSHERQGSTALFRDMKKKEQGRGQRRGFSLAVCKKGAPMIMEPLVYLLVLALLYF